MDRRNTGFPDDRTKEERRKDLSDEELKELERAGGVEGGMQAGSAGTPRGSSSEATSRLPSEKRESRSDEPERRPSR